MDLSSFILPMNDTSFFNCAKPTIEFATDQPAIVFSIFKFEDSFLNSSSLINFIVLLVNPFLIKKLSSTLQMTSTIAFPIPRTFIIIKL